MECITTSFAGPSAAGWRGKNTGRWQHCSEPRSRIAEIKSGRRSIHTDLLKRHTYIRSNRLLNATTNCAIDQPPSTIQTYMSNVGVRKANSQPTNSKLESWGSFETSQHFTAQPPAICGVDATCRSRWRCENEIRLASNQDGLTKL